MLLPNTITFQSIVQVSDSGSPSREASCELSIRLFRFSTTVNVTVRGDVNSNTTFEQLLEDFLNLDIVTTIIKRLNRTHFQIEAYGKNATTVISADELAKRIGNLTDDQKNILIQAGFEITEILSNTPVQPPSRVPRPTIPAWAVVVIVIINSVIIIAVLVIILILLLRSLRK